MKILKTNMMKIFSLNKNSSTRIVVILAIFDRHLAGSSRKCNACMYVQIALIPYRHEVFQINCCAIVRRYLILQVVVCFQA